MAVAFVPCVMSSALDESAAAPPLSADENNSHIVAGWLGLLTHKIRHERAYVAYSLWDVSPVRGTGATAGQRPEQRLIE